MSERNYQFRERLAQVHTPYRRDPDAVCGLGQIELTDSWTLWIPDSYDRVLYNAARDLEDYFAVSMGVCLRFKIGGDIPQNSIAFQLSSELKAREYRFLVTDSRISLEGSDSRAAAQAGYFLEDLCNLEEAPFVSLGDTVRCPLYSPRMIHSSYCLDEYPDDYLCKVAHTGVDAILVFVRDINKTSHGYLDFNDLIYRAAGYGLDVYVYSYLKNEVYPEGEEGQRFYDKLYGELFEKCPGFKGIVLVGESCEFRSRDPRTSGLFHGENKDKNGRRIVDKPNPGWYPCNDFNLLIDMIKNAVRKRSPEAEIILWSYNWGKQPEKERLELIRKLPKDIILQATFEMFEYVEHEGVLDRMADYCLYFEGPGKYFDSEAREAEKCGLKLYSMTNTGGMTWDCGVIPYLPTPQQWLRRYENMYKYHEECGLCGLMECHHYGFYPSFISDFAKWMFTSPIPNADDILRRIAVRDFSKQTADTVIEAWELFSKGIRRIVTNNIDQYGPMRIGPSYPLLLFKNDYVIPSEPWALRGGNAICRPMYRYDLSTEDGYKRIEHEIRYAKEAVQHFDNGSDLLDKCIPLIPELKRDEAKRLVCLGRFLARAAQTLINTKEWCIRRELLKTEPQDAARRLLEIGEREIQNAIDTIPLVEFDSRLGYEPSMEYMCDRAHLEWKIEVTREVMRQEVEPFLNSLG